MIRLVYCMSRANWIAEAFEALRIGPRFSPSAVRQREIDLRYDVNGKWTESQFPGLAQALLNLDGTGEEMMAQSEYSLVRLLQENKLATEAMAYALEQSKTNLPHARKLRLAYNGIDPATELSPALIDFLFPKVIDTEVNVKGYIARNRRTRTVTMEEGPTETFPDQLVPLPFVESLLLDLTKKMKCGPDVRMRMLVASAGGGHVQVVKRLLTEFPLDDYLYLHDAFFLACAMGNFNVVESMLQVSGRHRIITTARDNYAIRLAAEYGRVDVVTQLLGLEGDLRVDPRADNNYAIRYASKKGHLNVVNLLLDIDTSLDSPENYADFVDYKLALENGRRVDPTANDNFAICWAAERGHLAVVERLLKCRGVALEQ